MMQTLKQIHQAVTLKLQVDILPQQQTHILADKQIQQRVPLHLLQMGQMYPLTPLTLRHTLQCLKMFVAWVSVAPFLLWVLAYLVASMSGI